MTATPEKKTALIVDDVFNDLESMNDVLRKEGFRVIAATSVAQAMDALNAFDSAPDLILLDIKMPNASGYDLLKMRKNKSIPVVFVSIVPKDEVDLAGVDGFVQKPFSPQTLLAEIRSTLAKHQGKGLPAKR